MNIKQITQLNVKKLHPDAVIPKYAKPGDAGLDLTATSLEYKNGRYIYGTGLAFEIPEGHVGLLFPRSSINKYDLRLTNCVGVIDSGYRGEVKFVFENDGIIPREEIPEEVIKALSNSGIEKKEYMRKLYNVGDRIGQLIVMPYPEMKVQEVKELSDTERGDGGFGSSGK